MSQSGAAQKQSSAADGISEELNVAVLRDMLQQCEVERNALLAQIKDLERQLEEQQADKADIFFFLNKKLDDNYEIVSSLEQQLVQEQAARETLDATLRQQTSDNKARVAGLETRYKTRVAELEEKLQHLQEFSERKEELETNLQTALTTIEQERESFQKLSKELEMKVIQERDRLRKEHDKELAKAKMELEAKLGQNLSAKTKQTHEMNEAMKLELQFQSRQADYVLRVNQKIVDKAKHLEKELHITQMQEKAMVQKLAKYRRLLRELNTPGGISQLTASQSKFIGSGVLSFDSYSIEDIEQELGPNAEVDHNALVEGSATTVQEEIDTIVPVHEPPPVEVSQKPLDKYDAVANFLAEMYEELASQSTPDFSRPSTFETLVDRREQILQALLDAYSSKHRKLRHDRKLPKLAKSIRRKGPRNAGYNPQLYRDRRDMVDQGRHKHGESLSTFDSQDVLSLTTGDDGAQFSPEPSFFAGSVNTRLARGNFYDDPLIRRGRSQNSSNRDRLSTNRTDSQGSHHSSNEADMPAPTKSNYNYEKVVAIGEGGHHRPYHKRPSHLQSPSSHLLTVSLTSDR